MALTAMWVPEHRVQDYSLEIEYLDGEKAVVGAMCPPLSKGGYGILPSRLSDLVSGSEGYGPERLPQTGYVIAF
jgi:hypothetical protein